MCECEWVCGCARVNEAVRVRVRMCLCVCASVYVCCVCERGFVSVCGGVCARMCTSVRSLTKLDFGMGERDLKRSLIKD